MSKYKEKAVKTLEGNLFRIEIFNGQEIKTYKRTVPSKQFYEHQWNWDSATHALGFIYEDPKKAINELTSLISGQWKTGMIPHIIFNPFEEKYFPKQGFWQTEKYKNGDITTSGITQPPIIAISAATLYKKFIEDPSSFPENSSERINNIINSAFSFLKFLKDFRDPENSGLISILHPWESGFDNSPTWDEALSTIKIEDINNEIIDFIDGNRTDNKLSDKSLRPDNNDYYRYLYLVDIFKKLNWDHKEIYKKSPFNIKDVAFTSIFALGCKKLSETYQALGEIEKVNILSSWNQQAIKGLKTTWDDHDKSFYNIDKQNDNKAIKEETISIFTPLLCKTANEEQLNYLIDKLEDKEKFNTEYPVPSVPINSKKFDMNKYWRGPTWSITNLLLIKGLKNYKKSASAQKHANSLIEKTINMIEEKGFWEYFHPIKIENDTKGIGFGSFSWTAAIYLYLVNKYRES